MKVIKFKRQGNHLWEIAFNEKHLHLKLDGDVAEIIMPQKSIFIRIWRKVFPLKGIKCKINS